MGRGCSRNRVRSAAREAEDTSVDDSSCSDLPLTFDSVVGVTQQVAEAGAAQGVVTGVALSSAVFVPAPLPLPPFVPRSCVLAPTPVLSLSFLVSE